MSRPLAAARLLIMLALLTGSPVRATPGPSLAPAGPPALSPSVLTPQRVQTSAPAGESTTVLDINGSGAIRLHNRFLAGGLILYIAVMAGALVFLEKRRVAATAILAAGLIVGGLLLTRAFG